MPKFNFVDCLRRLPIGLWLIGRSGAFGLDPAGAGARTRAVR